MGAQDNTEKVLRSLHVLLSKSEPYPKEPSKVIIDKQQVIDLLAELNTCIYQIMDEYELTIRSRDKAERDFHKKGDQIIWDASRKAEDIYAASVMYMDETLNRMQDIMQEADKKVGAIYQEIKEQMEKEEKTFTVRLTPDKEFSNEVAFRFSKKLGVVANNDLAGTPFYISLKDLKTVKIPQEDGKKKKDLEGIAYNVPGQALVTLTDGKKKLYEGELPVTQFGIIEYLAPVLFNKNSTIKVYFDPNTGGLLKVDREEGK